MLELGYCTCCLCYMQASRHKRIRYQAIRQGYFVRWAISNELKDTSIFSLQNFELELYFAIMLTPTIDLQQAMPGRQRGLESAREEPSIREIGPIVFALVHSIVESWVGWRRAWEFWKYENMIENLWCAGWKKLNCLMISLGHSCCDPIVATYTGAESPAWHSLYCHPDQLVLHAGAWSCNSNWVSS